MAVRVGVGSGAAGIVHALSVVGAEGGAAVGASVCATVSVGCVVVTVGAGVADPEVWVSFEACTVVAGGADVSFTANVVVSSTKISIRSVMTKCRI